MNKKQSIIMNIFSILNVVFLGYMSYGIYQGIQFPRYSNIFAIILGIFWLFFASLSGSLSENAKRFSKGWNLTVFSLVNCIFFWYLAYALSFGKHIPNSVAIVPVMLLVLFVYFAVYVYSKAAD